MSTYDITAGLPKPKWYEFRKRLSNMFLWLAKLMYKENPEVYAFFIKQHTDLMIYGSSLVHVKPESYTIRESYGRKEIDVQD